MKLTMQARTYCVPSRPRLWCVRRSLCGVAPHAVSVHPDLLLGKGVPDGCFTNPETPLADLVSARKTRLSNIQIP